MSKATQQDIDYSISMITDRLNIGDFSNANLGINAVLKQFPKNDKLLELQRHIHNEITVKKLPGPNYLEWLQWFHEKKDPHTYVEIGVESGQSLQYAKKRAFAIGIDPEPKIVYNINAWSRIFKMTSDDFFAKYNLKTELGTRCVDLSFIDGLHTFDQTLTDFMNIEKYSKKDTIVLFHDVYPAIPETATRERDTIYWAGDTWKIVPILEKYRPDLTIRIIPAYPTGLAMVTNLDSHSTTLVDNFSTIVSEMMDSKFENYLPKDLIVNEFDIINELLFNNGEHNE